MKKCWLLAASMALLAGCRYDQAADRAEMGYAALDGSGEWTDILWPEEPCDYEREWHECIDNNTYTNLAGEMISLDEYCRLAYSEGESRAGKWLAHHGEKCDLGCEASVNSRIVHKYLSLFGEVENFEEELGKYSLWSLGGELYLVKTEEPGGSMGMHMYAFVMYDSQTDGFGAILPFDFLPESERAIETIRQARSRPEAMNNIAAMVLNNVAWHHCVDAEYPIKLLKLAAEAGEPVACRNLAIYYSTRCGADADARAIGEYWRRRAASCAKAKKGGLEPRLARPLAISEWPRMF